MQINRLNIDNNKLSAQLLIKIIPILSHIHSLRISTFAMVFSKFKYCKEPEDHDFRAHNSNITNVCLGQIDELKVNHFVFMNLYDIVYNIFR